MAQVVDTFHCTSCDVLWRGPESDEEALEAAWCGCDPDDDEAPECRCDEMTVAEAWESISENGVDCPWCGRFVDSEPVERNGAKIPLGGLYVGKAQKYRLEFNGRDKPIVVTFYNHDPAEVLDLLTDTPLGERALGYLHVD